jgi:hypothetical protein
MSRVNVLVTDLRLSNVKGISKMWCLHADMRYGYVVCLTSGCRFIAKHNYVPESRIRLGVDPEKCSHTARLHEPIFSKYVRLPVFQQLAINFDNT